MNIKVFAFHLSDWPCKSSSERDPDIWVSPSFGLKTMWRALMYQLALIPLVQAQNDYCRTHRTFREPGQWSCSPNSTSSLPVSHLSFPVPLPLSHLTFFTTFVSWGHPTVCGVFVFLSEVHMWAMGNR